MLGKRYEPELVTPQEVAAFAKYYTMEECKRAMAIIAALPSEEVNDPDYGPFLKLSAVYAVGRIQGIREERSRRKAAKVETATAAEIRATFLTADIENAVKGLAVTMDKALDYEESAKILLAVIESIPQEAAGEPPLDKMVLVARQAYIAGYLEAVRAFNAAAQDGYNDLFPGEREPDSSTTLQGEEG